MPDQEPPAESMTKRHTPPGGGLGTGPETPLGDPAKVAKAAEANRALDDLPTQKASPIDPPRHPHDPARSGAEGQIAGDAQQARKLGAALARMEAARAGLEALVPPEGWEGDPSILPSDAECADRLVEYLGARDQMSDAMRAFGPPR